MGTVVAVTTGNQSETTLTTTTEDHARPVVRGGRIVWPCQVCGEPVGSGEGYLEVDSSQALRLLYAERKHKDQQRAEHVAQHGEDSSWLPVDLGWYFDHHPVPWLAHHRACDPNPGSDTYWVDVRRLRTPRDVLGWTSAHHGKALVGLDRLARRPAAPGMTPTQLLAAISGLSHEDEAAQLVATVATVCPDCGEDYDELGSTARCRERHELRLTSGQRQLYYRGRRADADARRALTRAKRAAKAGDWATAASVWKSIPRHRWGLEMVNRLRVAACASCAAVVLTGDEDDRVAGSVRADPWRLTRAGEVAAIVLERPTWRLWGSWPSYRAVERLVGIGAPPDLQADQCVVVAAHVCGTRLDGEPIAAAIAHTRPSDEIPF